MDFSFVSSAGALRNGSVLLVCEGHHAHLRISEMDKRLGGALCNAIVQTNFVGAADEVIVVHAIPGAGVDYVALIGIGAAPPRPSAFVEMGGRLARTAIAHRSNKIDVLTTPLGCDLTAEEAVANLLIGIKLGAYRYDRHRTSAHDIPVPIDQVRLFCDHVERAEAACVRAGAVADGVMLARNLVNAPPNLLTPIALAEECAKLARIGVEVQILEEAALRALGMNAMLSVAAGSANPPAMVVLRWCGSDGIAPPLVVVGKGVTFDSGGLCLKSKVGLEVLKEDMAGAAAVIGLMHALASAGSTAHVVGVVGLVENMPDGASARPGDVITTYQGLTIENVNTDAEGRVVLSDLLAYAVRTLSPRAIIDVATLTGAVVTALGGGFAGAFTNDQSLMNAIAQAGQMSGERVWQLPIDPVYEKDIKSDFADLKNMGRIGEAGAIYAAHFLQHFVGTTPWVHLDIAGMSWRNEITPLCIKGGTGFGVRLLEAYVASMTRPAATDSLTASAAAAIS